MPRANRYVFLSNEADVLREMRAFLANLPSVFGKPDGEIDFRTVSKPEATKVVGVTSP